MSYKLLLAFAAYLPIALAGCLGGGGGGTPASSTATPPSGSPTPPSGSPTPPSGSPTAPVTVKGINVTHIESTDGYGHAGSAGGSITLDFSGRSIVINDYVRHELICPGGNMCREEYYTIDGTRYLGTQNYRVARRIAQFLRDTSSWSPPRATAGIDFFSRNNNKVVGGVGEHSLFFTATGGRSGTTYVGETISQSLGYLHDGIPTPSESEPSGSAMWRGAMLGTDMRNAGTLQGDARLTLNFADSTVDVEIANIEQIAGIFSFASYSGPSRFVWNDLRVNNDASFYIPGHSNDRSGTTLHPTLGYIEGNFYGPNAEEVAGVFERDWVSGAWLAIR